MPKHPKPEIPKNKILKPAHHRARKTEACTLLNPVGYNNLETEYQSMSNNETKLEIIP